MNVRNQACCLVALLSMWGVANGQEPEVVPLGSVTGGAIVPESIPAPLPQTPAVGAPLVVTYAPPLAVLDRGYYIDKKRREAAARQYDHLLQGYPSSWAHSHYPPLYVAVYPNSRSAAGVYNPSTSAYRDGASPSGYGIGAYRNSGSTMPTNTYRPPYTNPFASGSVAPGTSAASPQPTPQPNENAAPQPEIVPAPPANRSKPVEL